MSREPVCVNAHDRCYGGAGGPCPYCEVPPKPARKPKARTPQELQDRMPT